MNTLPKKFEFCTSDRRTTRYQLTLNTHGKYECRSLEALEYAYDYPAEYSVQFVQEAINCGNWIITKNLDEPEMKFPFTVLHKAYVTHHPDNTFKVFKSAPGKVDLLDTKAGEWFYSIFTVEQCKSFIKDGIWLVKHVGEKIEEKPTQYSVKIDDKGYVQGFGGNIVASTDEGSGTGFLKAPQAPQSTTISTLKVNVECNTAAAVEAVERLKNAIENLNMAYESLIELQNEMKGI